MYYFYSNKRVVWGFQLQCSANANSLVEFNGNPVVSYRKVGSGNAIYIGFDFYTINDNTSRIISNAIQWSGKSSLSDWLSLSTFSDTVNANDTSIIYVTINSN